MNFSNFYFFQHHTILRSTMIPYHTIPYSTYDFYIHTIQLGFIITFCPITFAYSTVASMRLIDSSPRIGLNKLDRKKLIIVRMSCARNFDILHCKCHTSTWHDMIVLSFSIILKKISFFSLLGTLRKKQRTSSYFEE